MNEDSIYILDSFKNSILVLVAGTPGYISSHWKIICLILFLAFVVKRFKLLNFLKPVLNFILGVF